jgi:GntR family transcriptional regulator/MocR family aminotransferase
VAVLRTNSFAATDLLVALEREGGDALHRQVEVALRTAIRSGRLPAGSALPSTRRLADALGVSRGVVVEAYSQLVAEGHLVAGSGRYTRVAAGVHAPAPDEPPVPGDGPLHAGRPACGPAIDFGYGRANVSLFPRAAWLRSVRRVMATAPDDRFAYLDGRGAPELRTALARYLNRVRGTLATPARVIVVNGYAQGVGLVLSALAAQGAKRLAVEDPSANDDARLVAPTLGMDVVGVPVGPDGLDLAALERIQADALIVTPSHQWPTGGVLSADARAAVIRWARDRGALIIEDDYDAEYRYDRAPVSAMHGLAPDLVVYAGTASKTLAPGFRLAWLIVPPALLGPVSDAKLLADRGSPVLDQLTFADFLERGEFARHVRRMRPLYRTRRDALLRALERHVPELRPHGISAGLHLVAWLPDDLDEAAVVAAAATHGVSVGGVAPYRLAPGGAGGLILGYATLTEDAIESGVRRLAQAVR